MSTKERLKIFLSIKKTGRNKFEKAIGLSNGYMSSKGLTITSEVIEKTLDYFPDLNPVWLLTGKGNMFSSGVMSSNNIDNSGNHNIIGNNSSIHTGSENNHFNTINIAIPQPGTYTIIKSDGHPKTYQGEPDETTQQKITELLNKISDLNNENVRIKEENILLNQLINAKDKIISLLDGKVGV